MVPLMIAAVEAAEIVTPFNVTGVTVGFEGSPNAPIMSEPRFTE